MGAETSEKTLIESKFETLISKSKDYINTRDENELTSLRQDIENLTDSVNRALASMDNGHSANYLTSRKLMLSIIQKFTCSVELMENMKCQKSRYVNSLIQSKCWTYCFLI